MKKKEYEHCKELIEAYDQATNKRVYIGIDLANGKDFTSTVELKNQIQHNGIVNEIKK